MTLKTRSFLEIAHPAPAWYKPGKPSLRDRAISALRAITAAQQVDGEYQRAQLRTMKEIQAVFKADTAILFLLDEENPELILKKQIGPDGEWVDQTCLKIEPGLVFQTIRDRQCLYFKEVYSSNGQFNPSFDSDAKIATYAFLSCPIVSKDQVSGALALINPFGDEIDHESIELFQILTNLLANTIHSARMFYQLKITNANLEASRWELLSSRNILRALFDNMPSAYIIDKAYTIIAINKSRSDRNQEKPSVLTGKKCFAKLYQLNAPCPGCLASETFETGKKTTRVTRETLTSQKLVEWEIVTYPISNNSQDTIQTIIIENDVTEERLLEAELIQSEKMVAIGQLAAGVAHEINNPLAAIIANAQMLQRGNPDWDEDWYDSLKLIETAGFRASQVVRSLLDIARKERAGFEILDLNDTIQHVLSLLHHEIIKHSVTITTDLQKDMPNILANRDQLQGVWMNLCMNALDAMDKPEGSIMITSQCADGKIKVTFSDNGKGIPEEQMSRIFEPFYTTKEAGRGTGLGLSICLRTVKQHNGSLLVTSEPGKGSIFTVLLPEKIGITLEEEE